MSGRSRIYTIIYDRDLVDTEELHRCISNSRLVSRWWHHIKSCYLVKSEQSAGDIADALPESMRDGGFLVVEVDLENSNG